MGLDVARLLLGLTCGTCFRIAAAKLAGDVVPCLHDALLLGEVGLILSHGLGIFLLGLFVGFEHGHGRAFELGLLLCRGLLL